MRTNAIITTAMSGALLALAALAPAAGQASAGTVDTTPPDPYIRARERQDLHDVLRHGIQATCGTADDERPSALVASSVQAERRQLSVLFIIVIDGFTAPIGLPFKVCIIERCDVLLVREAITVKIVTVAIHTAIDIGALIGKSFTRE